MIDWLKKNRKFIKIDAINRHLHKTVGMPNTSLSKAVNDNQDLLPVWKEHLRDFLVKLKK